MKTSNATRKVKSIKSRYISRHVFAIVIFMMLTLAILFIYLSSQYFDFEYCAWIKKHFDILFIDSNKKLQMIINIAGISLVVLINIVVILISYYVNNTKYQKDYLNEFFEELKLNEIYLLEKRLPSVNSSIDFAEDVIKYKKMNIDYLFSIKSIFNINFTQLFSKSNHKKRALLVSCENEQKFDGYVEFRFEDNFSLEEIDSKGLYKFIINYPDKYPYPLFINTNLGKLTHRIINDKIISLIYDLRKFTRSNFVLTIHKNKVFIYINGWELRVTNSLRKKLTYNSIDKKIDSFIKLVDDFQNLYICILRNYEVIKYGK